MKILAEILPSGQIYSVGQFPDDINPTPLNGGTFYEISERVSPETYYWNGTEVVLIPPSPNVNFKFNYATGTWEDGRTLAEAKLFQINFLQTFANKDRLNGFKLNGILYKSDIASQTNIISLTQAAQEAISSSTPFSAAVDQADGTTVIVDATSMIRIGTALAAYIDSINSYISYQTNLINTQTSNSAIYAIVWELEEMAASWNKVVLTADGEDEAILGNLPNPSEITINAPGAVGTVPIVETDGVFEMTTTVPGKYLIIASSPKYISLVTTLAAN